MNTTRKHHAAWQDWISPLKLVLLAINAVCFGACVVLLVVGTASGPLVVLTIATGLSFTAGLIGAIVASRKRLAGDLDVPGQPQPSQTDRPTP